PYTSLAAFNAAQGTPNGPGAGDTIYLRQGTGTYSEADGINLMSGQTLIGGGQDLVVGGDIVETGTGRPTIVTTGSGNAGVELSTNNKVSGLDIGTTTGPGIADGNGTVGNLVVTDVGVGGAGQIVDIDQGGNVSITLNSAASTASTGGAIDLNIVSGSFTVTGATTITGSHTGGGVDVTNSSLAVTFAGGGNIATGSARGVNFVGNTGGSLNISGGGFDITTTSGRALNVENGGTVSIGGAGNNIVSTTGTAVTISNAASGGVTLESVSSAGGSAAGVVLNNAGSGGFTVTGIGSVAGSGGSITGKSGTDASAATQGTGIVVTNTANVSLSNMAISGHSNYGILGTNVTNFTLRDSTVAGTNGNNAALNESSVSFNGLTGTALFEGNVISGGAGDNLRIVSNSGTLTLSVKDSANDQAVIGHNGSGGNDGMYVQTGGTAALTVTIEGVAFLGARADLLQINAVGSAMQDIAIRDSSFVNTHANTTSGAGGVVIGSTGGTNLSVDYVVTGNVFQGATGNALAAQFTGASGSMRGYIADNVIGIGDGVVGTQGSSGASGIIVTLDRSAGASGSAIHTVNIADNEVYDIHGTAGIHLVANGGGAASPSILEATVTGNSVDELGDFAFVAFYAAVGGSAGSGDFARLGLDLRGNRLDAGDADFGANAALLDQISSDAHFYFPGYTGSPDGEYMGGTASADLDPLWADDNVFVNGGFPSFAGGVDAGLITDATGDPLTQPVWFG
ncbi:MAG: hypothetical protein M3177_07140, partial [Pseudomonadota bacterium]|nr:hypothetical protein [Pseudomonadota bacterium]